MKRQTFVSINLVSRLILIFLVLFLSVPPTGAEDMPAEPTQVLPSISFQQGPADPEELDAFLDGVITAQLNAYHIPGATVAVVKDGKLFFAKGYGYLPSADHIDQSHDPYFRI